MHPEITFRHDILPRVEGIISLYQSAGLNRPVQDADRIGRMYEHSNLVITAWDGEELIGIARALTDFSYCCYLSDLAVHHDWQSKGIGRELIRLVNERIGEECMLLLLSAPGAMEYYPKVGFEKAENAFLIRRRR